MEAPEKLYYGFNEQAHLEAYCPQKTKLCQIEYIRTDAFIEKACEWLSKHATKYYFNKNGHYLGTDELVEDFKLSMEL